MTACYCDVQGEGPALVMLHGWGLHAGVWTELAAHLAQRFRVYNIDLPGHGRSPALASHVTLETYAEAVLASVPTPARWLGWSLGGLVALAAALDRPDQVERLVLVSSTPRFVQAPDWGNAMPQEDFSRFAAGLQADPRSTLLRFLSLQVGTGERERDVLRHLRRVAFAHGEPAAPALAAGLNILEHTDLRSRLPEIRVPALVVHGSQDSLVPPAASEWLAARMPRAGYLCLDGAGHAPFLSRPLEFEAAVGGFLA